MSWWHERSHPIWTIAQILTVTVAVLALSYVNASHFDAGEIKTVLGTTFAALLATRLRGGGQ